jgi:hypothetical protein
MKTLVAIALVLATQVAYLDLSAAGNAEGEQKTLCQELLSTFQGRLSRGLRDKLRTAHGNTKITGFLLVPDRTSATVDGQAILNSVMNGSRVEYLGVRRTENGKIYLKVRGTRYPLLGLIADFKDKEDRDGQPELFWAGLRTRPRPRTRPTDLEFELAEVSRVVDDRLFYVRVADGQKSLAITSDTPGANVSAFGEGWVPTVGTVTLVSYDRNTGIVESVVPLVPPSAVGARVRIELAKVTRVVDEDLSYLVTTSGRSLALTKKRSVLNAADPTAEWDPQLEENVLVEYDTQKGIVTMVAPLTLNNHQLIFDQILSHYP